MVVLKMASTLESVHRFRTNFVVGDSEEKRSSEGD